MVNQPGTKHHGIEAKLKQESEIAEAHRNALATATHTPRWCCRPREENDERRVHCEIKRLELAGWVRKELAELGHASQRWRRRWFDGEGSTENGGGGGKIEQESGNEWRRPRLNRVAQKLKEAALWPSPRQRDAKNGHDRAWKQTEDRRR